MLKIRICFVETSCTKILKFLFNDDGVTLKLRETPALYGAIDELASLAVPDMGKGVRKTLESILESDAADYRIKSFIEPTLIGKYRL